MFPVRKESPEEPSKPRRRRAQTDDSIRSELLRQQVAEDRRRKLAAAMENPKREVQVQSPAYDRRGVHSELGERISVAGFVVNCHSPSDHLLPLGNQKN